MIFLPKTPPQIYFEQVVRQSYKIDALLKEIELATSLEPENIGIPLRRLIVTGLDTFPNMSLLFGAQAGVHLSHMHAHMRLEVLLKAPPGSPSYVFYKKTDPFDPSPARPRPPSNKEALQLAEVRRMQRDIHNKLGVGVRLCDDDMKKVWKPDDELGWAAKARLWTLATDTMDQGLPGMEVEIAEV